jgi:hypothetical protein
MQAQAAESPATPDHSAALAPKDGRLGEATLLRRQITRCRPGSGVARQRPEVDLRQRFDRNLRQKQEYTSRRNNLFFLLLPASSFILAT